MLDGKRQHGLKRLWEPLAVLLMIALVGLYPARSWSQGNTYKAPIPKPVNRPAPKATEKAPPSSPQPAKPASVDYENEIKKLNSLIAANDKNADAYYNRGWLYEHKGDLEAAEKDYSKAIALDRNHKEAYYNRGLIFIKKGKLEDAIGDFS